MVDALASKTFQFKLVSPERVIASEQAAMAVVPGAAGDFGVLPDHAPLLSSVRPGVVTIYIPSGETRKIFITGGFADVTGNICSVLAEEAINVSDIDRAQVEENLRKLNDDLGAVGEDTVRRDGILHGIEIAKAKLAAVA